MREFVICSRLGGGGACGIYFLGLHTRGFTRSVTVCNGKNQLQHMHTLFENTGTQVPFPESNKKYYPTPIQRRRYSFYFFDVYFPIVPEFSENTPGADFRKLGFLAFPGRLIRKFFLPSETILNLVNVYLCKIDIRQ